jgi:hypothetical protein
VATAEAYYFDIPTILETTFGGMFEKKKRKAGNLFLCADTNTNPRSLYHPQPSR